MRQALHNKLLELIAYQPDCGFEDALQQVAAMIGELLHAARVSIMLRDVSKGQDARLKLVAVHGQLPDVAWKDENGMADSIASRVLAGGQAVCIDDIARSDYLHLARRPGAPASFMACPVNICGQAAGVLNISEPRGDKAFTEEDRRLAELAALVVGRLIQTMRLSRVLDSRFTQMALTLEGRGDSHSMTSLTAHEPERVAKMLAKAFYKEMHHCGFTPNQIIHAAGEIISELTGSLNRHKQRIARKT